MRYTLLSNRNSRLIPLKLKRKLIQCASKVARDAVSRETIGGVEHIRVRSSTLPDDIVMNGLLYPAEEISASYATLENTLAPVEHPIDTEGRYISATDPTAIHNFHAGAFNQNVRQENGCVKVDKIINVHEALKSDRGRRLLDRINELETSDNPRALHTSVGVWLEVEPLGEIKTNSDGHEYEGIARNLIFDHDAILLDTVGAATPEQGVGMAINQDGVTAPVEKSVIDSVIVPDPAPDIAAPDTPDEGTSGVTGVPVIELLSKLNDALRENTALAELDVVEVIDETVVFKTDRGYFQVAYHVDQHKKMISIVGVPMRVERNVTYSPKVNSNEGDAMKELIVNALKSRGIDVDAMSDTELFSAYNETFQANQDSGASDHDNSKQAGDLAEIVANALSPLTEELTSLREKINAEADNELTRLAGIVANSGKYPGIDIDTAKGLPADKLKELAANCPTAHGIPFTGNSADNAHQHAPLDMPE